MIKKKIYDEKGNELIVSGVDSKELLKSGKWSNIPVNPISESSKFTEQKKIIKEEPKKEIKLNTLMETIDPKAIALEKKDTLRSRRREGK